MSESANDRFVEMLDAIHDRVDAAIAESQSGDKVAFVKNLRHGKAPNRVFYSAYDTDDDDNPIDNLDEIPFKGTFVVVADYDGFWDRTGGDGELYISEPVTNPTWLQLTVLANEAIHVTGDEHHIFFEGVALKDEKTLLLVFGS